jgi:hypothetical protein
MSVAGVRAWLVTRLQTIDGLRAFPVIPDDLPAPCAYLELQGVTWDESFDRGVDNYVFHVTVVTSISSWMQGQTSLDAYVEPSGPTSIKEAIEADETYDARVVGTGPQLPAKDAAATLQYISQVYTVDVWVTNN